MVVWSGSRSRGGQIIGCFIQASCAESIDRLIYRRHVFL